MSLETRPRVQHLSAVPPCATPSSSTPMPESDFTDDAEYAEALAIEIDALATEAKVLLDRSVRLSVKLKDICEAQQRKLLSVI